MVAKTHRGDDIVRYTLRNRGGLQAEILNYGATLMSLRVPDRGGKLVDVVLGFDDAKSYFEPHPYFGAIIGRYANRIDKGRFQLNGVPIQLSCNRGETHLHGGNVGFDKVLWKASGNANVEGESVELDHRSPHKSEGYPGNLSVQVTYTLTTENELRIKYVAQSDKDTIINLTNHSYFNLAGAGSGDITGHEIEIPADYYTPVNANLIPTGEMRNVAGTPFDFRKRTAIAHYIDRADEQLFFGKGFDHNFVLAPPQAPLAIAARVHEPRYGVVMSVWTSQPGLQFYTGNHLDIKGKGGRHYGPRSGLTLETQRFPDSPNHPNFPSTVLAAGKKFFSTTVYRFAVD